MCLNKVACLHFPLRSSLPRQERQAGAQIIGSKSNVLQFGGHMGYLLVICLGIPPECEIFYVCCMLVYYHCLYQVPNKVYLSSSTGSCVISTAPEFGQ